MNKQRERELKKRIRRLKQRRTFVLVGESTGVTVEQLDVEIEAIRKKLKRAKPLTPSERISFMEYIERRADGERHRVIADDLMLEPEELKEYVYKNSSRNKIERLIAKKREEKGMARTAKLTVDFFKEKMAQGVTIEELSSDLGLKVATIKQYERIWKKQGLLDDVEKKKEVVAEAKAIVAEPVAKVDDSYKLLAQQYRDELEKMGAELEREKEVSKRAVAELHEVQRERIQLHSETGELAEELANAAYEYAELKRDYNMLVTIAKPFVEQFAKELAVKE